MTEVYSESESVDLEFDRFALRTFAVRDSQLQAVIASKPGYWKGGVCEAECVLWEDSAFSSDAHERLVEGTDEAKKTVEWVNGVLTQTSQEAVTRLKEYLHHDAPDLSCKCGVYGSLNLANLRRQYTEAHLVIAVIAAEGPTIIGTRGLRTAKARIVAYWVPWYAWGHKKVCERDCPGAVRYRNLDKMLEDHGIPKEASDKPPVKDAKSWWCA